MDRHERAPDAGLDQEREDRLSGSLNSDPTAEESRETDPDFEAWLDQRAQELDEARCERTGFAAGDW